MTREVSWTRIARSNLSEQISFIAKDNPVAARNTKDRVLAAALALGQRPIGRLGRVAGTFEKSVSNLPYIIVYRVADDTTITILRVIHSARDWSEGGWPT